MRKLLFYTTLCCLLSLSLTAQHNNSLSGKILFLNSDNTPAVGVELSGSIKLTDSTTINANIVYSKHDGSYTLLFPKAVVGSVVELKVGATDVKRQAIEVVNEEELRICRIPEDPAEAFEIIVCKKGERDFAAKKYYNILKTAADYELDKMKKQWSALVEQSEKDYQKIAEMSERITQLEKQVDSLQLYKDALRIASINKDNATKRVKKYLKLLDEGIAIQEARTALSINKAIDELEVGTLKFNAAVTELQTRATASEGMFDYKDAIKCYDTLIYYAEKMGVDRLKMAGYYYEIAIIFLNNGNYANALKYKQKAIDICEKILDPRHPNLAASYNNIGVIYQDLGQYENALKYHQKAIEIDEEILDYMNISLAITYNSLGGTYQALGQYKDALKYLQKAIEINKEILDPRHPDLAASYNNIGVIYQDLGQYENALKYKQKAMRIAQKTLASKHPNLATAYDNIGTTYQLLSQYENALKYHQKAIAIREAILDPKHPDLAISHNNIAMAYHNLHQYKNALEYHQKGIAIREEILDPKHPYLAACYSNIGITYRKLGQYENALRYQQKSMVIREEVLDYKHPDLGVSYYNIAVAYRDMNDFQKAIAFIEKCLTIFKDALPKDHPYHKGALNIMAGIYYVGKDYPKAIEIYQKVVEAFPETKEEDFYSGIGMVYARSRQFKKAHEAFSKYEKLFPDKGQTYRNWAAYYALQYEEKKALDNLKKAVELGYKDLEWLKIDGSMDSFRDEKVFIEIIKKLEKEQRK